MLRLKTILALALLVALLAACVQAEPLPTVEPEPMATEASPEVTEAPAKPTAVIACDTDSNTQEATYLNAIQPAITFQATPDTVVLRDGFGQEVARSTRVG